MSRSLIIILFSQSSSFLKLSLSSRLHILTTFISDNKSKIWEKLRKSVKMEKSLIKGFAFEKAFAFIIWIIKLKGNKERDRNDSF